MNEPQMQHNLPKTYLRRWSIDPAKRNLKSMVYCWQLSDRNNKIKPVSIDANLFKTKNFYTVEESENKYGIEELLQTEVEPLFNKIIDEISSENSLSMECRKNLILWLHISKIRGKQFRENLSQFMSTDLYYYIALKEGKAKADQIKNEIEEQSLNATKYIQLKSLFDKESRKPFDSGIGIKHWSILKAQNNNSFITNEDPGFSIIIRSGNPDMASINSNFSVNQNTSIFYPVSPKYCLYIRPDFMGEDKDLNLRKQVIEYFEDEQMMGLVNRVTLLQASKYIVSNNHDNLQNLKDIRLKLSK